MASKKGTGDPEDRPHLPPVCGAPRGQMTGGGDGHSSGAPVAERLMRPTRAAARRLARHLRITPGCLPLLLGLAPGGVFPAAAVAGGAVRSYRTVSPLPPARHAGNGPAVYFLWHFPWGRPRRALPGTVPPWSPDFPLPAQRKAAIRPSGTKRFGLSRCVCQSLAE